MGVGDKVEDITITTSLPIVRNESNKVQKLNLNEDIDFSLSDVVEIDRNKGDLKFCYHKVRDILDKDIEAVSGIISANNDTFQMTSTINEKNKSYIVPRKEVVCLINKPITQNDVNLIMFKMKRRLDVYCHVTIAKDFEYKMLCDSITKELAHREVIRSDMSDVIISQFIGNRLQVMNFTGQVNIQNISNVLLAERDINYSIDFYSNTISANRHNIHTELLNDKERKWLYFFVDNYKLDSPDQVEFTISNIEFANVIGYIYFKPFTLEARKIQINLFYTGQLQIEYYTENRWNTVRNMEIIEVVQEQIRIRIKMKRNDRLYGGYILLVDED